MDWKKLLINPQTPILKTLEIIDINARQIALVVDHEERLLGTVTDGDIRRGLLKGKSLQDPASSVMNPYPTVASPYDTRENILALMKVKQLNQIPVVDDDGKIIDVEILNDILRPIQKENWVILMAGGLGTRLAPLTRDCPKPLLRVGDKPLLETILMSFLEQGFHRFYISVKYKADMIQSYFGDGKRWGVDIRYLEEQESLGTAGALSLLPEVPTAPFFVMNGDLLTKVNFEHLLDFHKTYQAEATMCVREYDHQIPYGVVKVERQRLAGIEEKPVQRFFVNAGIYVLEPTMLDYIPRNQHLDMPTLFDNIIREKKNAVAFPIREYWLDIGRISDFEKANKEYMEVFS
ncbi:nucleotidyltransferase family protein [Brevibacillus borstelensis]|uniref:nucleotidyltransferase family protein n=1 Tax=Brevibacillus borstelensis TaxID=45462 RepID=UPI0020423081|nr:nucleotidyltransferase family protein [Brevibacillus borstelensis]MCM3590176.1 nucleotidyltransferase family protein [Brevibacillus borstelensis]